MSTKSTIADGNNFHLYHEALHEDYVYLELEGVQFEAFYSRVMVPIPIHIWEHIRHFPGIELEWADKTDDQIREHVEQEVDDRLRRFNEVSPERKGFISLLGSLVYGSADQPRESQIEAGTEYFSKLRKHHHQIQEAILALKQAARD